MAWGEGSRAYYIVVDDNSQPSRVVRRAWTGNETVLDAIKKIEGLGELSDKSVVIARPEADGKPGGQLLAVDTDAIARDAAAATNYPLLPGDRVFIGKLKKEVPRKGKSSNPRLLDPFG